MSVNYSLVWTPPSAESFSTSFPSAETPLSQSGIWFEGGTDALDWTDMVVLSGGGKCVGTHTGGGYDDSHARLTTPDLGNDYEVTAVVFLDPSIPSDYNEIWIGLRWGSSANNSHGYECNLNYEGAYGEIVRWNGDLGSYTYIGGGQGAGGGHTPVDGDIFKARMQGNTITTSLNGTTIQTADITEVGSGSIWTTGGIAIGAYTGHSKYGFHSVSAVAL